MSDEGFDTSYEPFSREPEYIEVNKLFVRSLQLDSRRQILDLACGTGMITASILEEMSLRRATDNDSGRPPSFVGLDVSWEALRLARRFIGELNLPEKREVDFIAASADCLPLISRSMDAVVMGNAIQLINDKDKLAGEAHRVLRPGGLFAFNTSFYAGTYAPGTEQFYLRWVQEAVSYIRQKDGELRSQGLSGYARKKGLAKPAFSQPWLSRNDYEQLLRRHGFEIESVTERTVLLTQRSFESIGSYAGLAVVLLSGYQVRLACEALEKSAGRALAAVNMDVIPRLWIEFIATKRN
jgi:ubiquinone/menaquinone biosynthesis C-methylase UbiE